MEEQKRVLFQKDYYRIRDLLMATKEDQELACHIVDACDVEESFPVLAALISAKYDQFYMAGSRVLASRHFARFVLEDLGAPPRTTFDLDWIMDMVAVYKTGGSKLTAQQTKFIINEYVSPLQEKSKRFKFKPVLNPKKK